MKEFWDERFSAEEYVYGEAPNDFLFEQVENLKKGKVLCLAAGEGRNEAFLATHGFDVTAVDFSEVGLKKAQQLAAKNGVSITTIVTDLAEFDMGDNKWDSIISFFCHVPPDLRAKIHAAVGNALKPNGTFLLEAYSKQQLTYKTGGPKDINLLMDLNSVVAELGVLNFLHAKSFVREVHEGRHHTGLAAVTQILAQK